MEDLNASVLFVMAILQMILFLYVLEERFKLLQIFVFAGPKCDLSIVTISSLIQIRFAVEKASVWNPNRCSCNVGFNGVQCQTQY